MPARICSVCSNAIVGSPVAVAEISVMEGGGPRLERSILCPDCTEWARTFLRPRRVELARPEVAALEPAGGN